MPGLCFGLGRATVLGLVCSTIRGPISAGSWPCFAQKIFPAWSCFALISEPHLHCFQADFATIFGLDLGLNLGNFLASCSALFLQSLDVLRASFNSNMAKIYSTICGFVQLGLHQLRVKKERIENTSGQTLASNFSFLQNIFECQYVPSAVASNF